MNKSLRALLKTAIYVVDQFSDRVDRASDQVADRVSDFTERGKAMVSREQDHTLRNVAIFAAGLGVGIGVGILWAPASGQEMRDSISKKVQNIGEQVGEGLRTEVRARPSGTEPL